MFRYRVNCVFAELQNAQLQDEVRISLEFRPNARARRERLNSYSNGCVEQSAKTHYREKDTVYSHLTLYLFDSYNKLE